MSGEADFRMARNLVLNLVSGAPTIEELQANVNDVIVFLAARGQFVDRELLLRDLESSLNVFQPDSTSLDDNTGHIEWLSVRRNEIEWGFWDRYAKYLQEGEGLPPIVLQRLDSTTARILGKLEDPKRPGTWDRRGMVVGQVQSGKTGNYTGLICRAADSGYKLIVVLAGIHNSLRSQTQLRLDAGFLGFDTQRRQVVEGDEGFASAALGVGRLSGSARLPVASVTNSGEKGDFGVKLAKSLGFRLGDYPVLLVVKKHSTILSNLREWLVAAEGVGVPKRIRSFPVLVIDDEADNASINTRESSDDPETEPTSVNRAIRRLLQVFDQRAYIGYTATPFANIYIDPDVDHPEYGHDLFPRSFIEYLRPPSNYFGPVKLFGLDRDAEPLPLHREVDDTSSWIPDRHSNGHRPGPLPPSVVKAIRSFVLARAVRIARGAANAHNSMLIHVTRFTSVQDEIRLQVDDELETLKSRIKYGDGEGRSVRDELHQLWNEDFVPTSESMGSEVISWEQIDALLSDSIDPIVVKTINGQADDALEYFEHQERGLNVIAIGGNKLSRGLTLEGLTVSYYLRASRTFDTLLQMGRWFGYRPGYEDMCRLWTSRTLWNAYREVSLANEELISEFEEMALRGRTPQDFGLKVRNSVDGMLVTAANKMREGSRLRIGFAGTVSETVVLPSDRDTAERNFQVLDSFVAGLKREGYSYSDATKNHVWSEVPGEFVAKEFFDRFRTADAAWRVNSQTIAGYIRDRLKAAELTDWTVALVSNSAAQETALIAGYQIGLTKRSFHGELDRLHSKGLYSIRRILSPIDECSDFAAEETKALLEQTKAEFTESPGSRSKVPDVPSGRVIRRMRPPERGLLILYPLISIDKKEIDAAVSLGVNLTDHPLAGFAVSFPSSSTAEPMEYVVNRQFLEELFGDVGDEDGEDS